jgi:hypothetical protein
MEMTTRRRKKRKNNGSDVRSDKERTSDVTKAISHEPELRKIYVGHRL